jgi:hypothetical protein
MDSFGINSTKSCGVYLDIQWSQIKKFELRSFRSRRVLQFDIKFVLIEHLMRKLWKFFCTISLSVQKTDIDSIGVGSWLEPTMIVSVSVLATNWQWWLNINVGWSYHYWIWQKTGSDVSGGTITVGFLKTDSDEADSECQICCSALTREWCVCFSLGWLV